MKIQDIQVGKVYTWGSKTAHYEVLFIGEFALFMKCVKCNDFQSLIGTERMVGREAFEQVSFQEVKPEPVVTERFQNVYTSGSSQTWSSRLECINFRSDKQNFECLIKKTYHDGVFVKLEVIE